MLDKEKIKFPQIPLKYVLGASSQVYDKLSQVGDGHDQNEQHGRCLRRYRLRRVALVSGAVANHDLAAVVDVLVAGRIGIDRLPVPSHRVLLRLFVQKVLEFLE